MRRESIFNGSNTRVAVLLSLAALVGTLSGCNTAPPEGLNQTVFSSPEIAVKALAAAARSGDTDALLAIFGPEGKDVLSSGDPVADRHNREVVSVALDERWTLEKIDSRSREVVIGHERWPFPIPLVKEPYGWRFDTASGKDEVLARRIGRNELAAIDVCRTYVIAQKEYAAVGHDGKPAGLYAQKVRSEPGKEDGLYWAVTTPGGRPSPLGDLAAQATVEGYFASAPAKPRPFRGYFFRILTGQGKDAPGGAKDYVVNGEMKDGFALVAWPAEYGNSGIMTFVVSHEGKIHQRDLGEGTAEAAAAMTSYDPGQEWKIVGSDK